MLEKNHRILLLINIIISIALSSSFIAFFFFTYAKDVERLIVVKNVKYVINDVLGNKTQLIPDIGKDIIANKISQTKLPDMTEEDERVKEGNNKLLDASMKLYSKILIGAAIISIIIAYIYKFNFSEILLENFILLGAVAFTEYLFLTYIIANYISADPNKLKTKVISKLFS